MRYIQHSEKRNKSDMRCVMCCWYWWGRVVDVGPCRVRLAVDSFNDFVCRIVVSLLPTPSFTHSVGARLLVSLGAASCVSFPNHTMRHCRLLIVARNDSFKVVEIFMSCAVKFQTKLRSYRLFCPGRPIAHAVNEISRPIGLYPEVSLSFANSDQS